MLCLTRRASLPRVSIPSRVIFSEIIRIIFWKIIMIIFRIIFPKKIITVIPCGIPMTHRTTVRGLLREHPSASHASPVSLAAMIMTAVFLLLTLIRRRKRNIQTPVGAGGIRTDGDNAFMAATASVTAAVRK